MNELRLEVVGDPQRFRSLSDPWSSLLDSSGQDSPTLSPTWVLAWWEVFSRLGGRELSSCAFWDGDRLVALAPLQRRTLLYRGLLPLRRIELLCSGEPVDDEVHSEYLGVVVERGHEGPAAAALATAVSEGHLGPVDEFHLPFVNGEDVVPPLLRDAFRARGWAADLGVASHAPFVQLPSSWEAYLAALPSRRRKAIRGSEMHLESWADGQLQEHVALDEAGLARGRTILERLHSARWQAAGQSGVFASERFSAFHDRVMPALLSFGALELMWLEARGEPIAALYNIVWKGKVHQYQAGRRADLPSQLRPGFAIHARAIRRAIDRGRSEYDFLGGTSHYKTQWAQATRPLLTLSARRPGTRQAARTALDRALEVVRSARSRVRPGPGVGAAR